MSEWKKRERGMGKRNEREHQSPRTHHVWCKSKPNSDPSFSLPLHDKVEKLIIPFVCVDSKEEGALRSLAPLREGADETECGVVDLRGERWLCCCYNYIVLWILCCEFHMLTRQ